MTNETCGHVDDTDSVDPFEVLWPKGSFADHGVRKRRIRLAKEALADAGYQIVPIQFD